MEALLLLVLITGLGTLGVVGLAEHRARLRQNATWRTMRVHFGREVPAEAVRGLLERIAGLHGAATVVLDVMGSERGIEHYLSTDEATLHTIRGSLRALLPSLRLEPADAINTEGLAFARSIRLGGRLRTLRQADPVVTNASLLAALQPLGRSERVLLRWTLRGGRARTVPTTDRRGETVPLEERRMLRRKNEGVVLRARGVMVATGPANRARHLFGRLASVLRTQNTAYGFVRTRGLSEPWLSRIVSGRRFLVMDRYAVGELVPLVAWPLEAPNLPGVTLGTSPQLIPSSRLPSVGRVFGAATWPGQERPIAQPILGALSHSLIVGPTGTGKSTLLANLLSADLVHGRGAVLIDGKGDTAQALLERIPPARRSDVIVLDCASDGPLPGIKLFTGADGELAADVILGVLSDLFKDSWGPLSERYLRAGLLAVAADPTGTLADVPFVFSKPAYRRKAVARLRDPLARATFAAFEAMGAAERQQQLAAPLNKLGMLLGRPTVRTVLGQSEPQLDFRQVLRSRQIVLVSLAPARIGARAARLIGAMTVFALFQAVQARSALPADQRGPFYVAIDEPKALGDLPMPLDVLLEQARGLGVGVTLSPQSISQLPKVVREAALTNVATRVAFRQDADDARLLARDLRGVTQEDLQDLAAYEAVARIGLGPGDVAPPVTIRTAPLTKPLSEGVEVRASSVERYGQPLAQVDAALEAKHRTTAAETPIGRKRRMP